MLLIGNLAVVTPWTFLFKKVFEAFPLKQEVLLKVVKQLIFLHQSPQGKKTKERKALSTTMQRSIKELGGCQQRSLLSWHGKIAYQNLGPFFIMWGCVNRGSSTASPWQLSAARSPLVTPHLDSSTMLSSGPLSQYC